MNTRWLMGLALAALLTLGVVVAGAQSGGDRGYWQPRSGHFEKMDANNWRERAEGGSVFRFVEAERNGRFVELFDRERGHTVRLFADHMEIRQKNNKNFEKLYEGRWVK
jgi:hypothetical protein